MSKLHARFFAILAGAWLLVGCTPDQPVPVPQHVTAHTPCASTTFAGFPRRTPPIKMPFFVCKKDTYALEFNPTSKTSLWVTEHLLGSHVDEHLVSRGNDFRPDPDLPADLRSTLHDYFHSGYDRGHLAPAADFSENPVQMSWSFYLSNMVPQNPGNNRGIWADLERNVRAWAREKGQLYVITGPVYPDGRALAWIGGPVKSNGPIKRHFVDNSAKLHPHKDKVAVPVYLYKVILDPRNMEAVAFLIPNKDEPTQLLPRFATNVATVERLTGLTFFPDLAGAKRQKVIYQVNPNAWLIH